VRSPSSRFPYTVIIYPILFIVFPRLWYVFRKHGYVTAADFVRGRFGNRWLALAITITGIVATMPYIALQLVGHQVVIGAMGVTGRVSPEIFRSSSPSLSWRPLHIRADCGRQRRSPS
jgi:Na+/proline symporter